MSERHQSHRDTTAISLYPEARTTAHPHPPIHPPLCLLCSSRFCCQRGNFLLFNGATILSYYIFVCVMGNSGSDVSAAMVQINMENLENKV